MAMADLLALTISEITCTTSLSKMSNFPRIQLKPFEKDLENAKGIF